MAESSVLHGGGPASEWILRWAPLIPAGASVLDVACGAGRHSLLLSAQGCAVTAIDRDAQALAALEALHAARGDQASGGPGVIETLQADIESGPWPCPGRSFDAVMVTNYLWRPLWPTLLASLKPDGLLLVETFALGHERFGRPSNPQFLLRPGELLEVARGLHVLAFEDGLREEPVRRIQRLAARRTSMGDPSARGDLALHPRR